MDKLQLWKKWWKTGNKFYLKSKLTDANKNVSIFLFFSKDHEISYVILQKWCAVRVVPIKSME